MGTEAKKKDELGKERDKMGFRQLLLADTLVSDTLVDRGQISPINIEEIEERGATDTLEAFGSLAFRLLGRSLLVALVYVCSAVLFKDEILRFISSL